MNATELKELETELATTFEGFKATIEAQDAEIKKTGDATAETKAAAEKMQDAMDALELKFARAVADVGAGGDGSSSEDEQKAAEYKSAWEAYARKGDAISPDQVKLLTRGDDTTGGYLAPADMENTLIKDIVEFSPIRTIARVSTTTRHALQVPKRTGTFQAQWVGEVNLRSETDGLRYGMEEIPTHEMFALVDISQQNIEDSAFNLESELNQEFREQFGVTEGSGFVVGDAAKKPEGILMNSAVEVIQTETDDVLAPNDFINAFFALKSAYTKNATWVLNRLTIRDTRKMLDGDGNYIWQPGLVGTATPATILERPYIEATDMPTIADGAKVAAIGNFQQAYRIVDRITIAVVRDHLTQATSGAIRFIARKRVGASVVKPEAMKILQVA